MLVPECQTLMGAQSICLQSFKDNLSVHTVRSFTPRQESNCENCIFGLVYMCVRLSVCISICLSVLDGLSPLVLRNCLYVRPFHHPACTRPIWPYTQFNKGNTDINYICRTLCGEVCGRVSSMLSKLCVLYAQWRQLPAALPVPRRGATRRHTFVSSFGPDDKWLTPTIKDNVLPPS